jgi:hypothetical protein
MKFSPQVSLRPCEVPPDRTGGDTEIVGSHLIRHVLPIGEIHDGLLTNAQLFDRLVDVGAELRKGNQCIAAHLDLTISPSSIVSKQIAGFIGYRLVEISTVILDLTPPRATE